MYTLNYKVSTNSSLSSLNTKQDFVLQQWWTGVILTNQKSVKHDGTILSLALIINDDVSLQSLFPFWKLQIIYFVWIQDIVKTGFWSSAGMNLVAFYQSEIRCIFQQITVLGLALKTYLAYFYVKLQQAKWIRFHQSSTHRVKSCKLSSILYVVLFFSGYKDRSDGTIFKKIVWTTGIWSCFRNSLFRVSGGWRVHFWVH